MNQLKKALHFSFRQRKIIGINPFNRTYANNSVNTNNEESKISDPTELQLPSIQELDVKPPLLHRNLEFNYVKYVKQREVWIENFDTVKEKKKGLVDLHPKIFGTIPRLDLIFENIKWQSLYNKVVLYSAKTRAEKRGGGRKPHPQKGLGKARQGSIRAPHMKGGGSCHGPRNPTSYFYMLPYTIRVHGLTSTLSAKFAQDDIHVVDNLNIPTDKPQFIIDLIKERKWGSSILIVDDNDIMPRNITLATETINHVTLMPVYGLNVHSMLKHETLVLTIAAVNEIEKKLLTILNTASIEEVAKQCEKHFKN